MVQRFRQKSRFYAVVGLLLQALGWALHLPVISWAIAAVGSLLLMLAVAYFARSKGRNALWGIVALFPLVGALLGLGLLAALPDRAKDTTTL